MTHLNNANLNYAIQQELATLERKFKEYKSSHDVDNLQVLYQGLIAISHNLPAMHQERDPILEQYRSFDR